MDCSLPGSSVFGILQTRILEWIAMLSSRGPSLPRDWTHFSYVSCIGGWVLYDYCHLGSPVPWIVQPISTLTFTPATLFAYSSIHSSISSSFAPFLLLFSLESKGLPWWLNGKKSTCQSRKHTFNPWIRKIPWRRKWQPTPVFLLGKTHRQRSLAGYSPWDHKKSDIAECMQPSSWIKGHFLRNLPMISLYPLALFHALPGILCSLRWFCIIYSVILFPENASPFYSQGLDLIKASKGTCNELGM